MKCLGDFLKAIPWQPVATTIPVRLITQLSDSNPRQKDLLTAARQRQQIDSQLAAFPALKPQIDYRYRKFAPLHMRYAMFHCEGGQKLLYVLERGLDMEDERTGSARGDTYVLEFSDIPASFSTLLGL
jgi:hypothetical protein